MAKTTPDRVLKGITQTYMDKTGNPSPTYGTAVQEIGDAISNGDELISTKVNVGTVPFANIFDCIQSELTVEVGE